MGQCKLQNAEIEERKRRERKKGKEKERIRYGIREWNEKERTNGMTCVTAKFCIFAALFLVLYLLQLAHVGCTKTQ